MSRNKILSNSVFFTFISFLQPSISFFLLPIYLRFLSPEDYAVYNLMNYISFFIGIIAAARIYSAIYPFYYNNSWKNFNISEFMGTIMTFTLISAFLLFALALIVGPFLFSSLFSADIEFFPLGIYAVGSGIILSMSLPIQVLLRNQKKFLLVGMIQLSLIISSVVFQVLYIVVWKEGVDGALLAKMLASSFPLIIAVVFGLKEIKFTFKRIYLKKALGFSLPLMPYSLIVWFERFGDKFFLEHYESLQTLATYSFLTTICLMIVMVSESILSVLQPFLYELYSTNRSKLISDKINNYYTFYTLILLLFSSLIILVSGQLHLIISNLKYLEAVKYIPIAVLIYFLYSYINLFRSNLMYGKRSIILISTALGSIIILIGSFLILIPRMGIWGALVSNFMGFCFLFFVLKFLDQKNLKIRINAYQVYYFPLIIVTVISLFYWICASFKISMAHYSVWQFIIVVLAIYLSNRKKIIEIGATLLKSR